MVRIKTLFQGQPAQESGQIREGDVILAVNGQWVKGLSYQVHDVFLVQISLSWSFKPDMKNCVLLVSVNEVVRVSVVLRLGCVC